MPEQVWDQPDLPDCELWHRQTGRLRRAAGLGTCGVPETAALGDRWKGLRPHRAGLRTLFDCRRVGPKFGTASKSIRDSGPFRDFRQGRSCALWMNEDSTWCGPRTAGRRHNRPLAAGFGSAGFSADLDPPASCGEIEWTMHWTDGETGSETWLGYNVKIAIEPV